MLCYFHFALSFNVMWLVTSLVLNVMHLEVPWLKFVVIHIILFQLLGIIQRLLLCYTSVNRVTWELVVQSISKDFSSMISEDVIFKATRLLWKVNWLKKIFSRFCNWQCYNLKTRIVTLKNYILKINYQWRIIEIWMLSKSPKEIPRPFRLN